MTLGVLGFGVEMYSEYSTTQSGTFRSKISSQANAWVEYSGCCYSRKAHGNFLSCLRIDTGPEQELEWLSSTIPFREYGELRRENGRARR